MIDVYFIDVNVPREVVDALSALLVDAERERANRYRFDDDRRRSIVARAATRRLLGRYLGADPRGLTIVEGEHGKPALANREIEFNASHSVDLVALAFAKTTPVGIDIERQRTLRHPLALARRFFSADEFAFVIAADDVDGAFLAIWTAKEAIVKASGKGIGASDLRAFTVPFREKQLQPVTASWSVATIEPPLDGYHAAIAARTGSERIAQLSIDAAALA